MLSCVWCPRIPNPGELTPTMKVKRKAAIGKFKKEIDAMYDGERID